MAAKSKARAPRATQSKPQAETVTKAKSSEIIEDCYQTLALISGVRAILAQLEDHAIAEDAAFIDCDRLLGEAAQKLKWIPESIDQLPVGAANG